MRPHTTISASVVCLAGLLLVGCEEEPSGSSGCSELPGTVCRVAGDGSRGFNGDGAAGEDTWLYFPTDLAFDSEGRVVFTDFNNQRIRRVEADGTVTTLAGSGMHAYATPGMPALETAFENPIDLALLPDDRILVAELHAGRVLEIDGAGTVNSYAGTGVIGYAGDNGPAHLANLSELVGITLADDGTLYIADTDNHCIRAVSPNVQPIEGYAGEARVIWTISGEGLPGHLDGSVDGAMFARPHHMLWHEGALYVADTSNHAVRVVDLESGVVETLAGTGEPGFSGDGGDALEAQLREPTGLAVADDGSVFVADSGNHLIRVIRPDGTIDTFAGRYVTDDAGLPVGALEGDGGPASEARFFLPQNLVIGPDGDLYVADTINSVIRVIRR